MRSKLDVFHVVVIMALLVIIGAIALPRFLQMRRHENEARAIRSLKAVSVAQAIFRESDKEQDGNLDYGMLSELAWTVPSEIEPELGVGRSRGYVYQASYSYLTSEFLWFAVANPEDPGFTGDRSFNANQAGVIYYTTGARLALDTNSCRLP